MAKATSVAGSFASALVLGGCSGVQSALSPAGEEARAVYTLFLVLIAGGCVIWLLVVGLLIYASAGNRRVYSERSARRVILWLGAFLPATVLLALLGYTLWLMPSLRPAVSALVSPPPAIRVVGEQFWWRIQYLAEDGSIALETANELRLPVGERVHFELRSRDVIHSFWIPSLGGKMDMIPGRTNRVSLKAEKTGMYRGVCAEFCGPSHALMALPVIVMEREAYQRWIEDGRTIRSDVAGAGATLFMNKGCPACHAIAGTGATGRIGPDLTRFGQRRTVAAGTLTNTLANIKAFIQRPDLIKPGAQMPHFEMLSAAELDAIGRYLKGLK